MILAWLKEKSLQGVQPGSPEYFRIQRSLIINRPLLKRCYDEWYNRLLEDARSAPIGAAIVELGSGAGYLKELEPAVITSDLLPDVADRVIDARKLPFENESLRALLLTHVFHHIPDVHAFFHEAERALAPGGVISMIEVAHTPFARWFFKHFHHEPYNDSSPQWSFTQNDSMIDSNQALSWIIFERDRQRFEDQFSALQIERLELMPWFTYFVSGGVTMRCLVPRFMNAMLIGVESLLDPLAPLFSLHWHIRLRKR